MKILEIPKRITWTTRLTNLKVGEQLQNISLNHYRTTTSLVSSKVFKFQYPHMAFASEVNKDGKSFNMIRLENRVGKNQITA